MKTETFVKALLSADDTEALVLADWLADFHGEIYLVELMRKRPNHEERVLILAAMYLAGGHLAEFERIAERTTVGGDFLRELVFYEGRYMDLGAGLSWWQQYAANQILQFVERRIDSRV